MQIRRMFWPCLVSKFLAVRAADALFDFEKAPGGGPSTLRQCARYAYESNSRAGSIYSLGCQTVACVCRTDLIKVAHESITYAIIANCGKDADVDVTAALKLYNDYCSANGFAIPGYTYVSTSTVQVPTGSTTTTNSVPETLKSGSIATLPSIIATPTDPNPGVPSSTVTATVTTVIRSAGTKQQPWAVFQLLYLLSCGPIRYIYALAESIIVTYTPPVPSPAVSSVVTQFTTVQTTPDVSTAIVYTGISPYPTTVTTLATKGGQSVVHSKSITSTDSSNSSNASGKGNGALTKLEVVGIIIGILTAIITTVATVWMCARQRVESNPAAGRDGTTATTS